MECCTRDRKTRKMYGLKMRVSMSINLCFMVAHGCYPQLLREEGKYIRCIVESDGQCLQS